MAKKTKRKWNRAHRFARKKSSPRKVGHPVYIFGTSGKYRKYLTFTHNPPDLVDFEEMLHNIDPDMDGKEKSYVKKIPDVSVDSSFEEPPKKYRIHPDDKERIKKYTR